MHRVADAWRVLAREQRWAALTAIGLFVSMLLPWYSKTNTFVEHNAAHASQASLSAFQAFSFVEAAVLLVSAGVLAMLFTRAEGRDFHLPGGDGMIVTLAGAWAAVLIFYRLLDKPSLQGTQRITATVGVEWGIFIALLLALAMAFVGRRIRAGERGQPPLTRPGRQPPAPKRHDEDAETVIRRVDDDLQADPEAGGSAQTVATTPVAARPRPVRRSPAPAPDARERQIGRAHV